MKKPPKKQSPAMIALQLMLIVGMAAATWYFWKNMPPSPPPTTAAEPAAVQVAVAAADTVPSGPRWTLNPFKEPIAEDFARYDRILAPLGFQSGTGYSEREFYEMKRRRRIGVNGGEAEILKVRVKHDSTSRDDFWRAVDDNAKLGRNGWELTYYKNINQTWLVGHPPESIAPDWGHWIIKVAKGRRPNLNVE